MRLSEMKKEDVAAIPTPRKWEMNCGGVCDTLNVTADAAILLGTAPEGALPRAIAAAKLYGDGRVRYIVASGGVKWNVGGESVSEAEYMARVLMENGVPSEAILLDNDARSTLENMICSSLVIARHDCFYVTKSVVIVSDVTHIKRSLALAKTFLPRGVWIYAHPSYLEASADAYFRRDDTDEVLNAAIRHMIELHDNGIIEDLEL